MTGFVRMTHPDLPAHDFPDSPDVIARQEAFGWSVAEDGLDAEIQRHDWKVPDDARWVNAVHPDLPDSPPARYPNDPAVLADLWERGWRPANKADQDPDDAPPAPIGPAVPEINLPSFEDQEAERAQAQADADAAAEQPPAEIKAEQADQAPPAPLPDQDDDDQATGPVTTEKE